MKLYIDTSDSEHILIKLDDKVYKTNAREKKAQAILPFIVEKLNENNTSVYEITEVDVNTGPGSFTGLRVGVSVANALLWSLGLPQYFTEINYE